MGGAWWADTTIGWLNVPLPAGYDTVTIDYGHAHTSSEVRLCLCTMPNQMCSHYTCTILATHDARGNFLYTTKYLPGQAVQIEEGFAILNANIVITLSQRSLDLSGLQLFDRVLAPQEIVAVADQLRDDATHVAQNEHLRPRDIAKLYAVNVAVAHPNRTSSCEACAAGFYKDVAGTAPCAGCGLGKFFNATVPGIFESESCFYCLEGTYQDEEGSSGCKDWYVRP